MSLVQWTSVIKKVFCPAMHFHKLQIFLEIFYTNVQSLVWSSHVGVHVHVPPWDTNMAAGKLR